MTEARGGTRRWLVYAIAAAVLVAGGLGSWAASRAPRSRPPGPLRILPLGDSVTVGSRGTNAGYRAMLAELLTQAGIAFQFIGTKTHNPGRLPPGQQHHEGWTGRVIEAGPPEREGLIDVVPGYFRSADLHPDVILLMIGTNDVWVDHELDSAGERLDRLITRLVDKREGLAPHARLLLQQIIPNGDPVVNARVRAYNEQVAAVAKRQRARGNDVTLVPSTVQLSDLHRDTLHPVDSGYRKIAQAWFDALRD
jgi:hypothetical protein